MLFCPQTPHAQRQCCCLVCTEGPHHLAFLHQCSQALAAFRAAPCPKPALPVRGAERAAAWLCTAAHGPEPPARHPCPGLDTAGCQVDPHLLAASRQVSGVGVAADAPGSGTPACASWVEPCDSQTHVFQSGSSLGIGMWNTPWLR